LLGVGNCSDVTNDKNQNAKNYYPQYLSGKKYVKKGYLVEVGLRAQNAIQIFRVPHGIIFNTFKVKNIPN
jgi:hypothetical protein